jgi:hypothetical protein
MHDSMQCVVEKMGWLAGPAGFSQYGAASQANWSLELDLYTLTADFASCMSLARSPLFCLKPDTSARCAHHEPPNKERRSRLGENLTIGQSARYCYW